jgi:hypothetical protein
VGGVDDCAGDETERSQLLPNLSKHPTTATSPIFYSKTPEKRLEKVK